MEQYYERKARLNGETRVCDRCRVTKLSMYNDGKICRTCEVKMASERNRRAVESLGRFREK